MEGKLVNRSAAWLFEKVNNGFRPGGEWVRCDQMGELDNYTYLESSDDVDNRLFLHQFWGNKFSPTIF